MTMHQMSFADLKAAQDICDRLSDTFSKTNDHEKGVMWMERADILYDEMMDRLEELFKTKT